MTAPARAFDAWRHRFAVAVAAATLLLIVAGGLVTSTGSGLAVPDWPLSFGQVFPRMEGGVLYEHGHRLIASAVGLLTVILAVWTARAEPRLAVRRLGWAMLALVIMQGVLGGTTVLLRLPDAVSVAHAGTAQLFLALTVVMAVLTGPGWAAQAPGSDRGTQRLLAATALVIWLQILLGAVVRHTGAGLAIPDFPLALGRLVPPFSSPLVAWHYAHRVGALVAAAVVVWAALRVAVRHGAVPRMARPAVLLVALLGFQILLGALTVLAKKAVIPTTAHVAVGALLLANAVLLATRSHGPARSADEPAAVPGAL